ncbi:MAG: ABC transporter permease [Cyclobacteriaceae bacterium]|nr:ABC transporter permease [Cyclobacteriaceae bacterium]
MILSLSWKNIWRSKRRSFVVMGAIIVGVWALIFLFSFLNSFNEAYLRNAINYEYSHIQVHHRSYLTEPDVKFSITDKEKMISALSSNSMVQAYSARQLVSGMIASSKANSGVMIYGVSPADEAQVTALDQQLVEGDYFAEIKRNPVLISKKTADKLKIGLRSKVVLTFQNIEGEITSGAFRVTGIFDSKSPKINESVIYVRQSDISRLVGFEGVNEIAILASQLREIPQIEEDLRREFGEVTIRRYNIVAPEFDLLEQQSTVSKQMLTTIIMLALLFGIINTMLMAVLERTKEIGMLRSVGMQKLRVFGMIIWETLLLSLVAAPVGLMMGFVTNLYFGERGMDLSRYAESLKEYGYDSIYYPSLDNSAYYILMLVVVVTALIGAIYPAWKAIQLNPLEAIRKL